MILMVSGLFSAPGFCSDCVLPSLGNIFRHLLLLGIGLINRGEKRAQWSFIAESFAIDLFLISKKTLHCRLQNSSLDVNECCIETKLRDWKMVRQRPYIFLFSVMKVRKSICIRIEDIPMLTLS